MLRQREDAGFAYLYERYSGALFGVVLGYVGDRKTAEDVVQEVYINIFRKIDGYDDKWRLFTWMVSIARNLSIDTIRSKGYRNGNMNVGTHLAVGHRSVSISPEIDQIGIRGLCTKLKRKHWEVIELSYFQCLTQQEIARTLDIPLGTVKTRIRAGLLQLRGIME